ncbi:MAG TPA: hypothetical protein PLX35_17315, partial [Cyclobacteriaceae bacterium]|nr:hypothetical protein [Cyclobacteriaceae bacterium]
MVKHFIPACLVFLSSILLQAQTPTAFWGLQINGGPGRMGAIFKTDPDGNNYTITHNFQTTTPGNAPKGGMIKSSNGIFYGAQSLGGLYNQGLIYSFDPSTGTYNNVLDLSGFSPAGALCPAANGKYYGIASTADSKRHLYEADLAAKTAVIKHSFLLSDLPESLIAGPGGKVFGVAYGGGLAGLGFVFSFDPANDSFVVEKDFDSSISHPQSGLLLGSNGFMYGAAFTGGANTVGGLYRFDPATKAISLLVSFSTSTGYDPGIQLVQASSDLLVGVTRKGTNPGIFDYSISLGTLTYRYLFGSGVAQSTDSYLLLGSDGKVYGMAGTDVAGSSARIFQYDPVGYGYTTKYEIMNSGLNTPVGPLTESADHKLWAPCSFGGRAGYGGIFSYDPASNQFNSSIDFQVSPGGSFQHGILVQASSGKIYGTTSAGGNFERGTIFELNQQTGGITILKHIDPNLGSPDGGLIEYSNRFYGVSNQGGAGNFGTIFAFDPQTNGIEILAEFTGTTGLVRGESPSRSLVLLNNKFYGFTRFGGNSSTTGVLFEFDPVTKQYSTRHFFTAATGVSPRGQMIAASNGKVYGICGSGGTNIRGTLFEYDPSNGNYSALFHFSNSTGFGAFGGLVEGRPGHLFATLTNGGASNGGTIFEFDLTNLTGQVRHDFTALEGTAPLGSLMLSKKGKLYGLNMLGGSNGIGTWFEFDPVTYAFVKKLDMNGTNGATPANSSTLESVTTNQTITFGALPAKTVGDAPFSLNASSTSNLPV